MASTKGPQPTRESDLRRISIATSRRRNEFIYYQQKSGVLSPSMIVARGSQDQPPIVFTFPYPPQQIQYSNMSPELSEISRPGKVPLIAFNRFRAKQISFKFLLAVPLDGLITSIDEDIEILQELANTARPVYFTNLDRQISNPLNVGSEFRIFWSIIDLTFSSIRRNERNEVVAAEANITLVENNNPKVKAVDLPTITYTNATPTTNTSSGNKAKDADYTGNSYTQGQQRDKATGVSV
jgi:hypothetical protein